MDNTNVKCLLNQEGSCKGVTKLARNRLFEVDVYYCPDCELVFNAPMPTENQLFNYYEKKSAQDHLSGEDFSYGHRLKRYSRANNQFLYLKKVFGPKLKNARVLDFGSGLGCLIEMLKRDGSNPFGIELNKIYRQRNHPSVRNQVFANMEELKKYSSEGFDLIILSHVIEHLPDPASLVSELRNCLKSGGHLFIEIPQIKQSRVDYLAKKNKFDGEHIVYFSDRSLNKFAQNLGLSLMDESVETYGLIKLPKKGEVGESLYKVIEQAHLEAPNYNRKPIFAKSVLRKFFSPKFAAKYTNNQFEGVTPEASSVIRACFLSKESPSESEMSS